MPMLSPIRGQYLGDGHRGHAAVRVDAFWELSGHQAASLVFVQVGEGFY